MVSKDSNRVFTTFQIVALIGKCLDNRQQFLIMCFVITFSRIHLLAEKCYRMLDSDLPVTLRSYNRLRENPCYSKARSICFNANQLSRIKMNQNRGSSKGRFQLVKCLLLSGSLLKYPSTLSFLNALQQTSQGSGNCRIVADKLPIEISKSQEHLELLDSSRDRLVSDSCNLVVLHRDSSRGYNIS